MVTVTGLSKTFGSGNNSVTAVRDADFTIPTGSFAAIIGKSGSGKSTLLTLLGALDKPSSGSIKIDDKDITRLSERALTKYRSAHIGFVFQQFNLVPNLSALENVMLPMEFAGARRGKRLLRATALLNQVGITGNKQKRRPGHLSGGEQQRVAIARALANRPALVLADEPTGNLDSETGEHIFELLRNLCETEQTTIITVTHDMAIAKRCEQVLRIADGALQS